MTFLKPGFVCGVGGSCPLDRVVRIKLDPTCEGLSAAEQSSSPFLGRPGLYLGKTNALAMGIAGCQAP